MVKVDTRSLLSISQASKRGVSRLVRDAERGQEPILLRNNRPVAAVVSIDRLQELEDARDLALVAARLTLDSGRRTSLDDVLGRFGATREQLRADPAYGA